jgi:hypothetical protein
MQGQDDLERILEALSLHFEAVKLTSFDSLSSGESISGFKEIITKSNSELKRLLKELEVQTLEKDDLRFEIFSKF